MLSVYTYFSVCEKTLGTTLVYVTRRDAFYCNDIYLVPNVLYLVLHTKRRLIWYFPLMPYQNKFSACASWLQSLPVSFRMKQKSAAVFYAVLLVHCWRRTQSWLPKCVNERSEKSFIRETRTKYSFHSLELVYTKHF